MICVAARRTLVMSEKSHTTDTARPPGRDRICASTSASLPGSRPTSTTVPCRASSSAVRRPMPDVGPVTIQALAGGGVAAVLFMSAPIGGGAHALAGRGDAASTRHIASNPALL